MTTTFLEPDNNSKPLIDNLKIGVFQCEPVSTGKITYINCSGAEILGYTSPEDVCNLSFCNLFNNPDNCGEWFQSLNEVSSEFEAICKRSDGKKHTVGISSCFVFDSEGNKIRIDGTIRDIHASKKEQLIDATISRVNEILVSNPNMKTIYHPICDELSKIIEWDRTSITLIAEKGDAVVNFALTKRSQDSNSTVEKKMSTDKHYALHGSLLEAVIKTEKPFIVKDTSSPQIETDKIYAESGIKSRLGFPLKFKGRIIGSINFGSSKVNNYNEEHIDLLEKIAPSLAFGIENTEKLESRLEIEVVSNINKTLVSNLNMNEVDRDICDELHKIIKWDRVSITLLENKGDVMVSFVLTRGKGKKGKLSKTMPEKSHYPLIGSILEKVIRCRGPFVIKDTMNSQTETDKVWVKEGIRSRLAYPLVYKSDIIGSINFGYSEENYYNQTHIKLLDQIGPSLAFGIENTKLYERATKAEKEYKNLSQTFDSPWT